MNRFLKIALLFFTCVSIPLVAYFFVRMLIFETGCDPKFGCKASFQITMAIFSIPTLLATMSALLGGLIFKVYSFQLIMGAVTFGLFSVPVVVLSSKVVGSNIFELLIWAAYFLIGPLLLCKVVSNTGEDSSH